MIRYQAPANPTAADTQNPQKSFAASFIKTGDNRPNEHADTVYSLKNPIAVACFDLSMDFMHKDIRSGNTRPRPNPPMICDKYNMLILLISGIAAQDADIITKPAAITFSLQNALKTEPLTAEEKIAGKDENAVRSPLRIICPYLLCYNR